MKKIGLTVLGIIGSIFLLVVVFSAFDRNTQGKYVIVQTASGKVKVVSEPVFYWSLLAKTWEYDESFDVYLSKSDQDGGKGADTQAVSVTFNDKALADVSSVTKVVIPRNDDIRLQLHTEFRSLDGVKRFARSYVESVLKASGPFFKGAAAYSTERPAFESLIRQQLLEGKYATFIDEIEEPTGEIDDKGTPVVVKTPVTVIKEVDGLPVIADEGFFNLYGVAVRSFQLKSIDPDQKTLDRIESEKELEQKRRIIKSEAENAKQQTITANEKGKAAVAQETADQNVLKQRAVIQQQRDKEVATLAAEKARDVAALNLETEKLNAQAVAVKAKADADKNALLVRAGLTPQEKAEYENARAIGVASELAKVKFPEMMIIGGSGDGSTMNPFDAVGLESFIKIQKEMSGN